MSFKLGQNQVKAWETFITRQASVIRKIESSLEKNPLALPLHWYDVLLVLSRTKDEKLKLSEIAERMVTSKSALSRSLNKLEKRNLLSKEKCSEDGRVQYAQITSLGKISLKKSWVIYQRAIQENFGQYISDKEANTLVEILQKIPY